MSKKIIFDANAILRYILYDIPEQADMAEKTLQNNKVIILPEIIMEVVFVMFKFYKIPREEISEGVIKFLNDAKCENINLINAIKTFGNKNFDFVDCLLYEYSKQKDCEIFTFDENLIKLIIQNNKEE